jgi:hypothetical protein
MRIMKMAVVIALALIFTFTANAIIREAKVTGNAHGFNEIVLYGPGDWFVYYVAGRAITWAYNNWNNPYATRNTSPGNLETDGCGTYTCPTNPFGGGGGGAW